MKCAIGCAVVALTICGSVLGQHAGASDLSCVFAPDTTNTKAHEHNRQKYYECDASGSYVEKSCPPGYVYKHLDSVGNTSTNKLGALKLNFPMRARATVIILNFICSSL